MNIHEFQAKEILRKYGVAVPRGKAATNAEEAAAIAREFGGVSVVKAQIHAGGRGKAGGVKVCKTPEEVRDFANALIGRKLVTHQTGPAGREVRRVLVEEGSAIARELYLGIVIDRASGRVTMMASAEGGVEIEEVAARSPEKIVRQVIDPAVGLQPFQARKAAFALGLSGASIGKATAFMSGLYRAFVDSDASMAEINPLVVTQTGDVIALDAKMSFDDNSLFRHPEVRELRDLNEEDPKETRAAQHDLSYISLDGNIGCMVNGAGLAMATMDIIKHSGGAPANFLDVGGGATTEKVAEAFKILLSDQNVRAVLINIFGGIMKCDVLATGVVEAARQVKLAVPLVVRLEGTNVEIGKRILADSGLNIIAASDMADAARKAVAAAQTVG
ncbi:MAG TPA: ADP-forming succinate--CoA ligase subunit beta [Candidatus Binatia bacterium]|nr:ADP-forming succinate--CoA ligase subunit beta [Candidatus Binatia bacterium]